jgi:hypothetical protein
MTALTGCGGGGGRAGSSPATAAPAPSVPSGALRAGSRLRGDSFTAGIPANWVVRPTTTTSTPGVRETEVDSPRKDASQNPEANLIIVEYPSRIFPSSEVNGSLDQFVAQVVQLPTGSANVKTMTPRTHVSVGGTDAVVLAFQDTYRGRPLYTGLSVFRHAGTVFTLTLETSPGLASTYAPALDTVLGTWAWR